MVRRRVLTGAVTVLGVLLVLGGVAMLASRPSREAGFGWFAYAPLAADELEGLVVVNGARGLGAGLLAFGLVLLALAIGARLGRRGTRPGSRRSVAVLGALVVLAGAAALAVPRTYVALGDESGQASFDLTASSCLTVGQVVGLAVVLLGVLLLAGALGSRGGGTAR